MKNIKVLLSSILFFCVSIAFSQSVGINSDGSAPDPSAILDIKSTTQGLLIPRMTTAQRNALVNPQNGILVYDTDLDAVYVNSGTTITPVWEQELTTGNILDTAWGLGGNPGTSPGTNFLGTTDAQDLVIKTNGTERLRVLSGGNVGIGTTDPLEILHIDANTDSLQIDNLATGTLDNILMHDPTTGKVVTGTVASLADSLSYIMDKDGDTKIQVEQSVDEDKIRFTANGTERMRIDDSGINLYTDSLFISGGGSTYATLYSNNNQALILENHNGSPNNSLAFKTAGGGAYATPTVLQDNDLIGRISFSGYDGSSFKSAAEIRGSSDGAIGAGDMPGNLKFFTTVDGAGSSTLKMIIKNDGNVGIGTTTPARLLQLNHSTNAILQITDSDNGSTASDGLMLQQSNVESTIWNFENGYMRFGTNNSESMRINNTGNVGVGTTSPVGTFNVYNNESPTLTDFTQALTKGGVIISTDFTNNNYTPGLFWNTGNNNATKPKAGIWLLEDASGTDMYFGTSNNYGTGITNNGMVIDQGGNVGIGTTSPSEELTVMGAAPEVSVLIEGEPGSETRASLKINSVGTNNAGYIRINDKFIANRSTNPQSLTIGNSISDFDFSIDSNGKIRFWKYTGASFDGSPSSLLGVDANGSLVKQSASDLTDSLNTLSDADGDTKIQLEETADEDKIRFDTKGSERMIIDDNGNVGIGTTAPSAKFHIHNDVSTVDSTFIVTNEGRVGIGTDAPASAITIIGHNSNSSRVGIARFESTVNSARLALYKTRGSVGSETIVNLGDYIGDISFVGFDGTGFAEAATIKCIIDATPGLNDMPGGLMFSTSVDGSSTPTEKMRIDNAGNVGVGTTSPNSTLDVSGSFTLPIVSRTTNYTITASDYTILGDCTGGNITITLPTAVGITGRIYKIKRIDNSINKVRVATTSAQTIDGAASISSLNFLEVRTFQSDGSNWYLLD